MDWDGHRGRAFVEEAIVVHTPLPTDSTVDILRLHSGYYDYLRLDEIYRTRQEAEEAVRAESPS